MKLPLLAMFIYQCSPLPSPESKEPEKEIEQVVVEQIEPDSNETATVSKEVLSEPEPEKEPIRLEKLSSKKLMEAHFPEHTYQGNKRALQIDTSGLDSEVLINDIWYINRRDTSYALVIFESYNLYEDGERFGCGACSGGVHLARYRQEKTYWELEHEDSFDGNYGRYGSITLPKLAKAGSDYFLTSVGDFGGQGYISDVLAVCNFDDFKKSLEISLRKSNAGVVVDPSELWEYKSQYEFFEKDSLIYFSISREGNYPNRQLDRFTLYQNSKLFYYDAAHRKFEEILDESFQ